MLKICEKILGFPGSTRKTISSAAVFAALVSISSVIFFMSPFCRADSEYDRGKVLRTYVPKDKGPTEDEKEEALRVRAEVIVNFLRDAKAKLDAEVEGYFKKAEEELKADRFDSARGYVDKALREKEMGMSAIKEAARRLAEEEAQRRIAERVSDERKYGKVPDYYEAAALAKDEKYQWKADYLKKKLSGEDLGGEAEKLLEAVDLAEKEYGERKVKDKEAEERRRREEEMRREAEKVAEYLALAREYLEKEEFDKARSYVKKAVELNEKAKALSGERPAAVSPAKAPSAKSQDARKAGKYLSQAMKQLESYNFEVARQYAEMALKADPESPEAEEMLEQIDGWEKAYEDERGVPRTKPVSRKKVVSLSLLKRAEEYMEEGEYDIAKALIYKVLDREKDNRKALDLEREVIERESAELEKKEKTISEEESGMRRNNVERYLEEAGKLIDAEEYDAAGELANLALGLDAENAKAKEYIKKISGMKEKAAAALSPEKTAVHEREAKGAMAKAADEEKRPSFEQAEAARGEGDEAEEMARGLRAKVSERLGEKNVETKALTYARRASERRDAVREENEEKPDGVEEEKAYMFEYPDIEKALASEKKTVPVAVSGATLQKSRKVRTYLEKAREEIYKADFEMARSYAQKALKIDAQDEEAASLIKEIGDSEALYVKEREKEEGRQGVARKADLAVKKYRKSEKEKARDEARAKKLSDEARKYLKEKDFTKARKFAYEARDIAHDNRDIYNLITEIDKEEMFGMREKEEYERTGKISKAVMVSEDKKDPFNSHDEGKSLVDMGKEAIFGDTSKYKFGDIQEKREYTIDECVQLAVNRSQRMVMSEKQVELAEMRIWESRRELLPEVTAKAERSFGKIGTNEESGREYIGKKWQVEVKQNIFDGMEKWYKIRQMQANLEVVKLEREKVKSEVVENTKKAYYNLDKSVKAFAVQEAYKAKMDKIFDIVQSSDEKGLIPHVEYLKVKGQKAQADFQYTSSKEDINFAQLVLFQSLNIEPEMDIKIEPVESPGTPLTIGLENCYTLAAANRPELLSKEKMIEYYEFERKMNKAKGWPKIDFNGSFGQSYENFQPTNYENVDDGANDPDGAVSRSGRTYKPEWFAGVKGSIPFWGNTFEYNHVQENWAPTVSSFRGTETMTNYFSFKILDDLAYYTNLADARAEFEGAKYDFQQMQKDVISEVKDAYFNYKKAVLQMDVARAQVEHQKMFVDVVEERQKFGEMEFSRVLEEHEKFAEHKYGLVQGEAGYFISIATLNKAIGVPEYFKPEYENKGYNEWKSRIASAEIKEGEAI